MRMLLMISNSQMSLRELYTMVLDSHRAGWITSFMSGMPGDPAAIAGGYDAVIFELGVPNARERVAAALDLCARGRVPVITHVEGREAGPWTQELRDGGVVVVANPVTGGSIGEALDAIAARRRDDAHTRKVGVVARFRRLFTG